MTKLEFEAIMARKVPAIQLLHLTNYGKWPKFSWDNNRTQGFANLANMGLKGVDQVPLATYSPDMHKVIEHVFGRLKPMVQKELLSEGLPALDTVAAQQLVKRLFLNNITTESIANDVASLPKAYFVIKLEKGVTAVGPDGHLHEGVEGDYPPRVYR